MNIFKLLFGWGSGKGAIEQVSDTVERFRPGPVKEHEMGIEDIKAQDTSQDAARKAQEAPTHEDRFNRTVDALNRLPRPLFAFWAFGELAGMLPPPPLAIVANPVVMNVVWTIIGFYFGIRTVTQDVPRLLNAIRNK